MPRSWPFASAPCPSSASCCAGWSSRVRRRGQMRRRAMDQGNQGNNGHPGAPGTPELVHSPTLPKGDEGSGFEHLAENRRMIVRRALLATTVGGIIPIPVLDEYFAGRVRAGMLMKLAERRRVDLASSSAELI